MATRSRMAAGISPRCPPYSSPHGSNCRCSTEFHGLRNQVVAQLSKLAARYAAKELPPDASFERASKLVEIDSQKIAFDGARLTWQLTPRRKLNDDEQLAVLADVEQWLRSALINPAGGSALTDCASDHTPRRQPPAARPAANAAHAARPGFSRWPVFQDYLQRPALQRRFGRP